MYISMYILRHTDTTTDIPTAGNQRREGEGKPGLSKYISIS
jgi:hypothetical protein